MGLICREACASYATCPVSYPRHAHETDNAKLQTEIIINTIAMLWGVALILAPLISVGESVIVNDILFMHKRGSVIGVIPTNNTI